MSQLPDNGTPRGSRTSIVVLFAALILTGGVALGYGLGLIDRQAAENKATEAVPAFIPLAVSCDGAEAVRARNEAWTLMNSINDGTYDGATVKTPQAVLTLLAATIIKPEASPELRAEAMKLYQRKGMIFFEEKETETLIKKIFEGTPDERANWFGYLNLAELEAAQFTHCLLLDKERIAAYLQGEPIPLEETGPPAETENDPTTKTE